MLRMRKIVLPAMALLVLFGFSSPVFSQSTAAPNPAQTLQNSPDESSLVLAEPSSSASPSGGSSFFPYVLRMFIVLGLIIAVIYGLYVLLKRASRPKTEEDTYLKILASTSLGPGKMLHVVSLGSKAWLLAASDNSVELISEISDKEIIDTLELRSAQAPVAPPRDFASSLVARLGLGNKKANRNRLAGDFLSQQRDRLKKL
ncbi:hypothetical protein MASR2M29_12470 [Spirochaetota bacterium]